MVPHPRRVHLLHPFVRGHPSIDAQLLLWRSDARGSFAAEGPWRSASVRYCWLHHGRAAIMTPKPYKLALMNQGNFSKHWPLPRTGDVADDEPIRHTNVERRYSPMCLSVQVTKVIPSCARDRPRRRLTVRCSRAAGGCFVIIELARRRLCDVEGAT